MGEDNLATMFRWEGSTSRLAEVNIKQEREGKRLSPKKKKSFGY